MTTDVLDLGTMAVLVGTVALGLEKVRMEGDTLSGQVKKLQQEISDAITEFDVKISQKNPVTGEWIIHPLCNNRHFHYLLRVARNTERLHYPRDERCSYRRRPSYWSAVMLNWMRPSWHICVLFVLTFLSLVCFLLQKWGQVYEVDRVGPFLGISNWVLQDICLYWIYTTTIVATIIFAIIAHMLASVGPRCKRYVAQLKLEKAQLDTKAVENMMQFLEAYTGSSSPPVPRDLRTWR